MVVGELSLLLPRPIQQHDINAFGGGRGKALAVGHTHVGDYFFEKLDEGFGAGGVSSVPTKKHAPWKLKRVAATGPAQRGPGRAAKQKRQNMDQPPL